MKKNRLLFLQILLCLNHHITAKNWNFWDPPVRIDVAAQPGKVSFHQSSSNGADGGHIIQEQKPVSVPTFQKENVFSVQSEVSSVKTEYVNTELPQINRSIVLEINTNVSHPGNKVEQPITHQKPTIPINEIHIDLPVAEKVDIAGISHHNYLNAVSTTPQHLDPNASISSQHYETNVNVTKSQPNPHQNHQYDIQRGGWQATMPAVLFDTQQKPTFSQKNVSSEGDRFIFRQYTSSDVRTESTTLSKGEPYNFPSKVLAAEDVKPLNNYAEGGSQFPIVETEDLGLSDIKIEHQHIIELESTSNNHFPVHSSNDFAASSSVYSELPSYLGFNKSQTTFNANTLDQDLGSPVPHLEQEKVLFSTLISDEELLGVGQPPENQYVQFFSKQPNQIDNNIKRHQNQQLPGHHNHPFASGTKTQSELKSSNSNFQKEVPQTLGSSMPIETLQSLSSQHQIIPRPRPQLIKPVLPLSLKPGERPFKLSSNPFQPPVPRPLGSINKVHPFLGPPQVIMPPVPSFKLEAPPPSTELLPPPGELATIPLYNIKPKLTNLPTFNIYSFNNEKFVDQKTQTESMSSLLLSSIFNSSDNKDRVDVGHLGDDSGKTEWLFSTLVDQTNEPKSPSEVSILTEQSTIYKPQVVKVIDVYDKTNEQHSLVPAEGSAINVSYNVNNVEAHTQVLRGNDYELQIPENVKTPSANEQIYSQTVSPFYNDNNTINYYDQYNRYNYSNIVKHKVQNTEYNYQSSEETSAQSIPMSENTNFKHSTGITDKTYGYWQQDTKASHYDNFNTQPLVNSDTSEVQHKSKTVYSYDTQYPVKVTGHSIQYDSIQSDNIYQSPESNNYSPPAYSYKSYEDTSSRYNYSDNQKETTGHNSKNAANVQSNYPYQSNGFTGGTKGNSYDYSKGYSTLHDKHQSNQHNEYSQGYNSTADYSSQEMKGESGYHYDKPVQEENKDKPTKPQGMFYYYYPVQLKPKENTKDEMKEEKEKKEEKKPEYKPYKKYHMPLFNKATYGYEPWLTIASVLSVATIFIKAFLFFPKFDFFKSLTERGFSSNENTELTQRVLEAISSGVCREMVACEAGRAVPQLRNARYFLRLFEILGPASWSESAMRLRRGLQHKSDCSTVIC